MAAIHLLEPTQSSVSPSVIAWEELVLSGVVPALHNRILVALALQEHYGATSAEVSRLLFGTGWALGLQSITPRFKELQKKRLVYKTHTRRQDPITGRNRTVWALTDEGRDIARGLLKLSPFLRRS